MIFNNYIIAVHVRDSQASRVKAGDKKVQGIARETGGDGRRQVSQLSLWRLQPGLQCRVLCHLSGGVQRFSGLSPQNLSRLDDKLGCDVNTEHKHIFVKGFAF